MKTQWNPALTLAKPSTMPFYAGRDGPTTWGWNATFCEGGRGFTSDSAAMAAAKEAADKHLAAVQAVLGAHTIEIVRGDKPYPSSTGYNYKVIIDGDHRATFRPEGLSRGYHLQDLGGDGIKLSDYDRSNRGAAVEKQAHFLEVVAVALIRDLIPTQAQVDAREAAYEARIDARHKANAQAAADYVVKGKVDEMLALLRSVSHREPEIGEFVEKLAKEAGAVAQAVIADPEARDLARYEVANNRDRQS